MATWILVNSTGKTGNYETDDTGVITGNKRITSHASGTCYYGKLDIAHHAYRRNPSEIVFEHSLRDAVLRASGPCFGAPGWLFKLRKDSHSGKAPAIRADHTLFAILGYLYIHVAACHPDLM